MAMGRPFAANPMTEFIRIRVTGEFKQSWKNYCKDQKVDGSKIIRGMMEKEMKKGK